MEKSWYFNRTHFFGRWVTIFTGHFDLSTYVLLRRMCSLRFGAHEVGLGFRVLR